MRAAFSILCLYSLPFATILADDPLITVSKETTFVIEPVNEDGFVDLVTAINAEMSKGITTETNAAALIYPALGPTPNGKQMSKRFFEELGVPFPAEDGNYFQMLPSYLKENGFSDLLDDWDRMLDNQGMAMERPWKRDEFPDIAAWIDTQEKPLQQILKGIERKQYYCPLNSDVEKGSTGQMLIATLLPHIQINRSVTRVLTCRAMLRVGEGRVDEGWSDLMASYRFGRHASHDPFLIGRLVGIAMEAITNNTMLKFIESTQPSEKTCIQYLKDLDSLPARSPIVNSIDFGERLLFVDVVAMLAYRNQEDVFDIQDVIPDLNDLFKRNSKINADWDKILTDANQLYDRIVTGFKQDSYSKQRAAFEEIDNDLTNLLKPRTTLSNAIMLAALKVKNKSSTTQFISEMLIPQMIFEPHHSAKAEVRSQQRYSNLQIAIALAAFHAKHNEYPASLDQLTSKYLGTLPEDHFVDQPLKYLKTDDGYLLYSVGDNQTDNGGKSYDEQKDDLVVRVPSKMSD